MNTTSAARASRMTAVTGPAGRRQVTSRSPHLGLAEVVTLIAIAVLLVIGIVSTRPTVPAIAVTRTLQVRSGDTLWSIARAHPIAGLTTAQTAEVIARENGLSAAALSEGQALLVSEDDEHSRALASR